MSDWKQALYYAGIAYVIYVATAIIFARYMEKQHKFNAFTTGEEILDGIDLKGKTAMITGASAGLGKETTRCLVKKGCKVYMACRNITKTEKVRNELIESLKKDGIKNAEDNLIILKVDLASLQSILDCAKKVTEETLPIDYLINNAGVMANPKYKETTDGIEWQFGINHIGHYYLTKLLMPLLLENKTRIINLSSYAHNFCEYKETEQLFQYCFKNKCFMGEMKNKYIAFKNYGITKASNILFTRYLNNEYKKHGVYAIAVHPGGINTELARDVVPTASDLALFFKMFGLKPWRIPQDLKNVQSGVSTTLNGVRMTNSDIKSTLYCYYENCRPLEPGKNTPARYGDDKMTNKLIDLSKALIESKGFPLQLNSKIEEIID